MINKLILLNSVLRLYYQNFLNLHWNSVGIEFNDAHKSISTEYYELCDKYIDSTAEMICRLGSNPLNYKEVLDLLYSNNRISESNSYSNLLEDGPVTDSYIMIDSNKLYTREEIVSISQSMLCKILYLIQDVLKSEEINDSINTGIRSDLESMHGEFDLQCRYINKRRMM